MTIWNRNILHVCAGILLLLSCKQQEGPAGGPRQSLILVSGESQGALDMDTKATGPLKPGGFGVMITQHNSLTPYLPFTGNIESKSHGEDPTGWDFRYDESNVLFNDLFLIENGVVTADVYAYAPFRSGMTPSGLESYPYSLADQKDVMWAEQNCSDFTFPGQHGIAADQDHYYNRDIHIDGGVKYVRFDFQHMLCKLEFYFRIKNVSAVPDMGTHYRLVGFKLTPKANTLVDSGSFNMRTGGFSRDAFRSAVNPFVLSGTVSSPLLTIPVTGEYSDAFSILLCPRDYTTPANSYEDGDYTFDFGLYGLEGYLPHASYVMKMNDLLYKESPASYGLKVGYVYKFYFTFDNYIHFDGVDTGEWSDAEEIEYGI